MKVNIWPKLLVDYEFVFAWIKETERADKT